MQEYDIIDCSQKYWNWCWQRVILFDILYYNSLKDMVQLTEIRLEWGCSETKIETWL